jgi:hypothetical protein
VVAACVAASFVGCDEGETDVAEAESVEVPAATGEPTADDEPSGAESEAEPADGQATGTVDGEPFVVRGVLARRLRESDPVEIRLLNRAASCETFDEDYQTREGEPLVVMYLQWPKSEGDTVAFRASEVHERFQFCKGREGDNSHARCAPRAPEQGSLTVLEASPEAGALSFDVSSDEGSLSGRVEFTLCSG